MKSPFVYGPPEADAETRIPVKVLGGRRPQEWGNGEVRQGREGSKQWCMAPHQASYHCGQLGITAAAEL